MVLDFKRIELRLYKKLESYPELLCSSSWAGPTLGALRLRIFLATGNSRQLNGGNPLENFLELSIETTAKRAQKTTFQDDKLL